MTPTLTVLRCRTSDRTPNGLRGAKALGVELGRRLGAAPGLAGTPDEARPCPWEDDLRVARQCLGTAGAAVREALRSGRFPVTLAGDCTICLGTLPAVVAAREDARLLWLDAHGDFNLPDTTPSGFLGGMCLAGACGAWDAGADPVVPSERVVLAGGRDVDPGERDALERSGVRWMAPDAEGVAEALGGDPAYVHVDLDVLDPEVFPAQFPAPGGLSEAALYDVLDTVADAGEVVGLEVTAFHAPEDTEECHRLARLAADALAPLLARAVEA